MAVNQFFSPIKGILFCLYVPYMHLTSRLVKWKTETERDKPCVEKSEVWWGICPQPCCRAPFKDTGGHVQAVCLHGEIPPKTEALIFLHILHLMIPAACNGIYRSSVEGASALAFIRFFVCIWCESARSFRSKGELFISFEVLPVGHGCVALLLCDSVYPLYQGVIGFDQSQSRTSSVAFRPLIIVDWSLNINFEELVKKKILKRL